jgi:hypothetical protein
MRLEEPAMSDDEISRDDISDVAYEAVVGGEHGFKRQWLHTNAESRPNSPRKAEKYLSEREIKYLLEGDSGNNTASRIEKEIKNKSHGLRIRLQRLLNDIALLSYGGYVNANDGSWENLTDTEKPVANQRFVGDISELEHTIGGFGGKSTTLGYDLGLSFRMLAGSAHEEDQAADFLWGILLANCATTSGKIHIEENNYEIIKEEIEQRSKKHFQTAFPNLSKEEKIERDKDALGKDSRIERVASQFGIESSVHLDLFIKHEARQPKYNNGEIKHLSEVALDDDLVQTIIEDCLNEGPLKQTTAITSGLSHEWENIEKASAPGVTATNILEAVWEKGALSSDDIAKQISRSSNTKYSNQVTQTLNKLSEDGKIPYPDVITTYRYSPLIEWYKSEYRSGEWKLTAYGRLFCRFVFDEDREVKSIHRKILSHHRERVDKMPDQLFENVRQDFESVMRGGKEILKSSREYDQ